jgi:hypothetical protein
MSQIIVPVDPSFLYVTDQSAPIWVDPDLTKAQVSITTKTIPIPHSFKVWAGYDHPTMTNVYELTYMMDGKKCGVTTKVGDELHDAKTLVQFLYKKWIPFVLGDLPAEAHQVVCDRLAKYLYTAAGINNPAASINFETQTFDGWSESVITPSNIESASRGLPGMDTDVDCPVGECNDMNMNKFGEWEVIGHQRGSLWRIIQHLNDQHRWTREKIADWIDELHDKGIINAEFQPWEEENE